MILGLRMLLILITIIMLIIITTMVADGFVARTAALQDVMVCFSARRWRAWSLEGRVRYLGFLT